MRIKNVFNNFKNYKSKFFHVCHLVLTITCIIFCIIGFAELSAIKQSTASYVISMYQENNKLDYYAAKQQLVREVDKYIQSVAPESCVNGLAIVDACIEYNIDIKFVLAQGHIESHFGTAGLAMKTHSIFNVLAYDGRTASDMKAKGHVYRHPDQSIRPFLQLLKKNYLVNGKTEKDLMKKYVNKQGARYASSPTYESDLTNTYIVIETTTNITKLHKQFIKHKILAEQ